MNSCGGTEEHGGESHGVCCCVRRFETDCLPMLPQGCSTFLSDARDARPAAPSTSHGLSQGALRPRTASHLSTIARKRSEIRRQEERAAGVVVS